MDFRKLLAFEYTRLLPMWLPSYSQLHGRFLFKTAACYVFRGLCPTFGRQDYPFSIKPLLKLGHEYTTPDWTKNNVWPPHGIIFPFFYRNVGAL